MGSNVVEFEVTGFRLGAFVGLKVTGLLLGDNVGSYVVDVIKFRLGDLDGLEVSGLIDGDTEVGLLVIGALLGRGDGKAEIDVTTVEVVLGIIDGSIKIGSNSSTDKDIDRSFDKVTAFKGLAVLLVLLVLLKRKIC